MTSEKRTFPESVSEIIELARRISGNRLDELREEAQVNEGIENYQYGFFLLSEILKNNSSRTTHFIQNARALTSILKDDIVLMLEYDNWYINLIELTSNGITPIAVIAEEDKCPFPVVYAERIFNNLIKQYGPDSETYIGVDFTSKEWLDYAVSKYTLGGVMVLFLESLLDRSEFISYIENEIDDEKVRLGLMNESFIGVRYIISKFAELTRTSASLKKLFDIKNNISIAHAFDEENVDVYWVEASGRFIVANDAMPTGIESGDAKTFNLTPIAKNTLNDYITQEIFKEFGLHKFFKDELENKMS